MGLVQQATVTAVCSCSMCCTAAHHAASTVLAWQTYTFFPVNSHPIRTRLQSVPEHRVFVCLQPVVQKAPEPAGPSAEELAARVAE
jgi:hypothetical protein